ncbi:hypothetical protein KIL84_004900 [Mauremys mutica]|uniref:H15 domain-containing protein n=1 Tax=Mauremys mutica TaxID=74926 RepID=A0A9D3XNZ4_9SAUR|nr:hypothetical protein KIL84_004900 [Mauremys mutica]
MRNLSSASQASPSEVALAAFLPKKRGRPSLPDLILRAVCVSTARKGASLAAIKKALLAEGYDVQKNNGRLKATLSSLVNKGLLQRVTGSGVSGSFRVNKHQKKGGALKGTKKKTAGQIRSRLEMLKKEMDGIAALKLNGEITSEELLVLTHYQMNLCDDSEYHWSRTE